MSLFRYFPFGIVFLVAGKILEMDDPSAMGKKLGFYAITVVMGLVLHGLFILPAMYFFITKKSPIVYIRGILQALLISLATSSRYEKTEKHFSCTSNNLLDVKSKVVFHEKVMIKKCAFSVFTGITRNAEKPDK